MPITIYPTTLKYKNQEGQFQNATAIKGDSGAIKVIQVNGTSPTIICKDNYRYTCGEVATLDITFPILGISDVIFESGSTPTILTINLQTGQAIKWATGGIDLNNLDSYTTYELNVENGLGVAAQWK